MSGCNDRVCSSAIARIGSGWREDTTQRMARGCVRGSWGTQRGESSRKRRYCWYQGVVLGSYVADGCCDGFKSRGGALAAKDELSAENDDDEAAASVVGVRLRLPLWSWLLAGVEVMVPWSGRGRGTNRRGNTAQVLRPNWAVVTAMV